ncbi:hypothetical protein MTO96_003737 [Rhipicephalus appendiculatus]
MANIALLLCILLCIEGHRVTAIEPPMATSAPEEWSGVTREAEDMEESVTTTEPVPTTTSEYDRFVHAVRTQEADGRKMMAEALKRILPVMIRMGHESGISSDCQMAYFKNMMGIKDLKAWALKSEYYTARAFASAAGSSFPALHLCSFKL